ncbi:threonine/serine ThrE exporter family protein [Sanguibacter suaedae]|uniref:Threonine/serine exporter family protein n=1 Tax=Sanguibacter suaedae TaxID=2795737 RepID=A0A934I6G2_9MICO|nr:threonine/serine exporter family protein [Sanguibacter suaedae]MBI9115111.1 threonine/serine exporter family protein [Sanguibacter suaedae]
MGRRLDVRDLVRRVGGGAPNLQAGLRSRPEGLDSAAVRGVLELGLRIGESMIALGASAVDVTQAIRTVIRAFGLHGSQVDLTFTSITVSYDRGGEELPVTMMRIVRDRIPDYGRLQSVVELAQEVAQNPVAPEDAAAVLEDAHTRLDAVVTAPQTYQRWVITVALSAMAGAVAVLLGGSLAVTLVAAATTAAIDRVVWALGKRGLPPFFLQAAGAAVAALVAVGLYLAVPHLPIDPTLLPPSLVVASGIVVLLAGLSLVGAAEDAISGFPITAAARSFEVVVLTLGIVVGITGVLDLARRFGVPLVLFDPPVATSHVVLRAAAAGVVALGWAVASYARPRAAFLAAGIGALSWSVLTVVVGLGAGPAVGSAVAALVVGVLSEWISPRLKVQAIVTSVCGIVPLLPGLAIYRGLFDIVSNTSSGILPGFSELFGAMMIGLGIAGGVTLGEFLGAPLRLGTKGGGRTRSTAMRGVTPRNLRQLGRRRSPVSR